MKRIFTAFIMVMIAGFFQACTDTLIEETTENHAELKSAQNSKITYIVVLDDVELNAELGWIKGYEMRQQVAQKVAQKVLSRAAVTDAELGFVYSTALKGFSVKIPPGQLKKLENDPSVAYIEKNQPVTLIEPEQLSIYELETQYTDEVPWGINRVGGGLSSYTDGGAAWIIDTGIDLDHPDLNVDATQGFSAFTLGRDKDPDDKNGHGTHVAGTIAAKLNNTGVAGVAPGAKVIPVKVLDARGSGSYEGVIAGVDHVAANGKTGDVANMSLGGPSSQALDDAVVAASNNGIKFTLAAGNESDDANNHSPARTNGTNIYTISAMDGNDNFASFSNYNNPPVDYCEPGVSILSTYKDGGYATASGTSMAAPHMAGVLLWGEPVNDGTVNNDPDNEPDPIGVVGTITNETGSLNGTVTDGTNGIVGATITVGNLSTVTDENGFYSLSTIPVGTHSVTASADGFDSFTEQEVLISNNETTTQNFILNENTIITYTISGSVKDLDSQPIGDVLIEIENTTLYTTTISDGTYSIPGVEAGTYNISASADGYVSQTKENISVTDNDVSNINFNLEQSSLSSISLQATSRKERGVRYVDLSWTGAQGTEINIKVNGSVKTTTANDGNHTLNMDRSSGTFTFQICETDDSACSNEVTLAL